MKFLLFLYLASILVQPLFSKSIWHSEVKDISLPEVVIINDEIKNFCDETLAPILRDKNFDVCNNVLKMKLDLRGVWNIEFYIANFGCLEDCDLPEGYIEGFCMINGYPMKVEAPAKSPFINVLDNRLTIKHNESNLGIDGDMSWFFVFINNELSLTRMWAVPIYQNLEGKNMNPKTGCLE